MPKKAFLTKVSFLSLNKYHVKYKDPNASNIACKIGNHPIDKALLNLIACINLLSYYVYLQMGLRDLKPVNVKEQLANR